MHKHLILNFHFLLFVFILTISCNGQNKAVQTNSVAAGKIVSTLDNSIWEVYQDKKGNYWFGSNRNGVYHYDGKILKQYTQSDGLIDNTIRGIQEDSTGNIFIETPNGISKYDGKAFTSLEPIFSRLNKWKLTPNDLWFNCNGNPNDVYRYDGESLYELSLPRMNLIEAFGSDTKGVAFRDMSHSQYSVCGINIDKRGHLWIGTFVAGAFRYDGKSFLWFPEQELSTLPDGRVPGVRSMIEDKDGYFWLSNFISKYKINDNGSDVDYEKLEGIDPSNEYLEDQLPYFMSGLLDEKGNLWMTTYDGGVWKYDGNKLHNFPINDGNKEVLLITIFEDDKGLFWLGTDNAGVYTFNGERFEKFEPMEGKSSHEE